MEKHSLPALDLDLIPPKEDAALGCHGNIILTLDLYAFLLIQPHKDPSFASMKLDALR